MGGKENVGIEKIFPLFLTFN